VKVSDICQKHCCLHNSLSSLVFADLGTQFCVFFLGSAYDNKIIGSGVYF